MNDAFFSKCEYKNITIEYIFAIGTLLCFRGMFEQTCFDCSNDLIGEIVYVSSFLLFWNKKQFFTLYIFACL